MKHLLPNVTRVLKSTRLGAQAFTIIRPSGQWQGGRWVEGDPEEAEEIKAFGNIQPATPDDLNQMPEGERRSGTIVIRTTQKFNMSGDGGSSDRVHWNDNDYRVVRINRWEDYGWDEAFLSRM